MTSGSDSDSAGYYGMLFLQTFGACLLLVLTTVLFSNPWNPWKLLGLVVALPALVFFLAARIQLGRSFSVEPEARRLVTRGVYSRVRHPMYVFSALYIFGLVAYSQIPWLLLIFAVLVPMQVWRMRLEDRVLEEKFGEQYRRYKASTLW